MHPPNIKIRSCAPVVSCPFYLASGYYPISKLDEIKFPSYIISMLWIWFIFITWKLPNFQFRDIFILPWLAISNMEIIQFPRCACGNCHISIGSLAHSSSSLAHPVDYYSPLRYRGLKRMQGNFFCPWIKGAPFIRYFRVHTYKKITQRWSYG